MHDCGRRITGTCGISGRCRLASSSTGCSERPSWQVSGRQVSSWENSGRKVPDAGCVQVLNPGRYHAASRFNANFDRGCPESQALRLRGRKQYAVHAACHRNKRRAYSGREAFRSLSVVAQLQRQLFHVADPQIRPARQMLLQTPASLGCDFISLVT